MGVHTHAGRNTYERIIVSARADGLPIGPKHHLHDRQLREYMAKTKNHAQLAKAREVKKVKGTLRKTKQKIAEAREKMGARIEEINADSALREKHIAQQRQKIAEGYKPPEWDTTTGKVKSVGNGL